MNVKLNIRRSVEIGVGMTVIATMLAGCFGGGGGTAAAPGAATTTTTVVPFKGAFTGGTVTVFDATHTQIGTGTINASGVATVTYPSNARYPLIVEASGSYVNEVTGLVEQTAAPLRAMVPDVTTATAASGVAASVVTELSVALAVQQNGGGFAVPLTPASAVAATTQAELTLGVPTGTAQQVPAVNASGVPANAAAATLAGLAPTLSVFSPTNLSQGLNNFVASAAALPAASGINAVIPAASSAQVTANLAAMNVRLAASGVAAPIAAYTPPASSVTQIQTATQQAAAQQAAAATAASNFLADVTSTGLRNFNPGVQMQWLNASGVTQTQTVWAQGAKLTATLANGVYTITHAAYDLVIQAANKVWQLVTGNTNGTAYVLTAAGWVDQRTMQATFTQNADGTATVVNMNGIPGNTIVAISAVDLAGIPIASAPVAASGIDANGFMMNLNASGVQVTSMVVPTGNFPTGAREYTVTPQGTLAAPVYQLWAPAGVNVGMNVTDMAGVALTALPAAGASFCANGFVFTPVAAPAVGADNYNVYGTMGCTAANITAATGPMMMPMGTALLANQAVGAVTVGVVQRVTGMMPLAANTIMGVAGGAVRVGNIIPAGTPLNSPMLGGGANFANQAAANAFLTAHGFSLF